MAFQTNCQCLDEDGYIVLPDILSPGQIETILGCYNQAEDRKGTAKGTEHPDLRPFADQLDFVLQNETVNPYVEYLLGPDYTVSEFSGRGPRPGFGGQGLHADDVPKPAGTPCQVVTCLWLLDAFTEQNGATRVVPGSHRLPGMVPKQYAQPGREYKGEKIIIAPAGSVLLFNGHLWHSGRKNESETRRRVIQLTYRRS